MTYLKKIAIGTAQFGLNYGVANKTGKLSINEIKKILFFAKKRGIDTIDTASAYGDCEERLGKVGVKKFKVITKLPFSPPNRNVKNWVNKSFEVSKKKLKLEKIYGLIVHNTSYLFKKYYGSKIYNALLDLKKKKQVEKIGISIYTISELKKLLSNYNFDIILVPFNVFDQRILDSKILRIIKNKKIEIYTRSSFLQGLLLMDRKSIPSYFSKWDQNFKKWENFLKFNNKKPIDACLDFVFSKNDLYKNIIGVDSFDQFKDLLKKRRVDNMKFNKLSCNKIKYLINPSTWKIKK
jgi:aryl-alcohol dehydrogenase-like predicted oxidoreductase